jgi:hypothetical protein
MTSGTPTDLLEAVLGDAPEERRDADLVVHVDPGAAAADGVEPGHLRGRGLQPGQDLLVVVLGIGVGPGRPDHLLGVDRLTVDDRGSLAVGGPEVEADPTAFQMAAQGLTLLPGGRGVPGVAGHHGERLVVDVLAHEVVVEGALAVGGVGLADVLANGPGAPDPGLPAAPLPEQELEDPLGVDQVGLGPGVAVREDPGLEAGDGAFGTLEGDDQRDPAPGLFDLLLEVAVGQDGGSEIGVQRGLNPGLDEPKGVTHEASSSGGSADHIRTPGGGRNPSRRHPAPSTGRHRTASFSLPGPWAP